MADSKTKTVLEVRGLSIDYPIAIGNVQAVRDVSFTLADGEVLGIVGESGCGCCWSCPANGLFSSPLGSNVCCASSFSLGRVATVTLMVMRLPLRMMSSGMRVPGGVLA